MAAVDSPFTFSIVAMRGRLRLVAPPQRFPQGLAGPSRTC